MSSVWKESVVSESKFWQGGETRGEAMRGNARVKEEKEGIKRAPYPKNLFLSLSVLLSLEKKEPGKKLRWGSLRAPAKRKAESARVFLKGTRDRGGKKRVESSLFELCIKKILNSR